MEIINYLKAHFAEIGVIFLMFYVFIKGVRDVLDKTPATDDNLFERVVTILGKLAALFGTGKRPQ